MSTGEVEARRSRLRPEERREQLLGVAERIITRDGTAALTMERVAVEAEVSKALVYTYFTNRDQLVSELVEREWALFNERARESVRLGKTFENRLRRFQRVYFDLIEERGRLLPELLSEPHTESGEESQRQARWAQTMRYWTQQVEAEYEISHEDADAVSAMLIGLTQAGGAHVARGHTDRDRAEVLCFEMHMRCLDHYPKRR
ncbi:MAG: TetR/AcrR family transcriptional regulator [Proteobacteria bacterium]|nr:TetR/AcrR family transcriptional regulator [Pseudomonadota bacterium]